MSEWREVPLAELVSAVIDYRGRTPKKSDTGVPLITAKVIKDGRITKSRPEFIPPDSYSAWMRRGLPQQGDILVTTEAPLGEVAQIKTTERIALAQRVILLRPDPSRVHPQFVFHFLRSNEGRARLRQRSSGTTVAGIRQPELLAVTIPLLAERQQAATAAVLDAFDELIAINERRIELLEDLARSLYREWFVRLRFPGHNSTIDGLPDGWQRRPASQVFTVNPRIRSDQTTFPKVTMGNVDERFAIVFPSEAVARASGSRFQRDDVLFARITPCLENGKTALVKFLEPDVIGVGSTEFIVLRGVTVGPAFTYCAARSDAVRQHAIKSMSGASGRQRVASNAFDALKLVEPSANVAAAFERCVDPLLEEGFALASQNRALARTRDILLPRLVTGRLDISDVDLGDLLRTETAA